MSQNVERMRAALEATRRWPVGEHELDVGMRPASRGPVAAFPVRVDRAHEVEVVGQRLLPKPYCLEGLDTTGMYLDADDQPLAKRELVGDRSLDRGTTLLA